MKEKRTFDPDDPSPEELIEAEWRAEEAEWRAKARKEDEYLGREPDEDLNWEAVLRAEGHGVVKGIGAGGGYVDDTHGAGWIDRTGDQRDAGTRKVDDKDVLSILERHRPITEYKPALGRGRPSAEARVLRSELEELAKVATVDFGATRVQVGRLLGVERKAVERLLG